MDERKTKPLVDTEQLIEMAKVLARPWEKVCKLLGVLLVLSIFGNLYQAVFWDATIDLDSNASFEYSDDNIDVTGGR